MKMLRPLLGGLLLLGLAVTHSARCAPGVFYVATNGNDGWSGSRPAPNSQKSDGPFATVPRALSAARDWKSQSAGKGGAGATIFIRGGLHFIHEPLALGSQDSGLTIAAYGKEKPVLSGGVLLRGWQETTIDGKRVWVSGLPEGIDTQRGFRELWVNGQRAVRARHPNTGYLKVEEALDKEPEWTRGQVRFRFTKGDLHAWPTVTNAEVIVMNRWVESHLPVFAVDEAEDVVRFSKRSVFQLEKGDLYYLEGALEALDQPGEWYLDLSGGKVYYLPRPGDRIETLEAIAPRLAQVLRLEGNPDANQTVEHVAFRGLTFAHTEWFFPQGFERDKSKPAIWPPPRAEVGGFGQAAVGVPGAVWGEGARDCTFDGCSFAHLGDYALELGRGCSRNAIRHCEFSDLGAGGIKLGETAIRKTPGEQSGDNEVSDCAVHDGGRLFHSAIGIWVGQSPNNRLVHNLIHDFYYTGISIGWTWGYGPALATNNLVAFNHVHHIGVKSDGDGPILSDMGGIYTLGMQPGTRVVNNLWHDIAGFRYGGWGIYFDEGSSSILATSNVVYRTTHGGFHQHYGATNFVENNIFALARDHQLQRTRPEAHISFSFETNIVYFDHGVLLGGDWSKDRYQIDWNLYWDARPGFKPDDLAFGGAPLSGWRARGHDVHSLVADPLFVAPQKADFRLNKNSPALKLGFRPIDLSAVGVRKNSR